jgi:RNA polymerase sigma-70 factor, ECF subfamily
VIDLQRRAMADRVNVQLDEESEGEDESWMDDLFDSTGHWRAAPQAWSNPEAALEQRRFWEAFEKRLHRSRILLRACLEKNWFGKDASRGG